MAKRPYIHINRVNDLPKKSGRICICTSEDNGPLRVEIWGDPKGLRYFAAVLNWLADFDQARNSDPTGTREHLHLMPGEQIDAQSCYVDVCRADAKGTGRLPAFMRQKKS